MGQQQSLMKSCVPTPRTYPVTHQQQYSKRIQHQGLLKLRAVPFKNCIQIQTDERSLFLQSVDVTLKDLLDNRFYTNKLFPLQDVERLIENITYTLAYLQQNNVIYRDLCTQNIFYDQGNFKILPSELIQETTYDKFIRTLKQSNGQFSLKDFVVLSPQMVIAYRCQQRKITDKQVLHKSTVFYLGLIFLQCTTLLPSNQCYDIETCDILDQVITERLNLVKEYYNQNITRIIANMLDYDYQQRMNLKQTSIFINRQLSQCRSTLNYQQKCDERNLALQSHIVERDEKIIDDQGTQFSQNNDQKTTDKKDNVSKNVEKSIKASKSQYQINPLQNNHSVKNLQHNSRCETINQKQMLQGTLTKSSSQIGLKRRKNKSNQIYMQNTHQNEQEDTYEKAERNKVYMHKQASHTQLHEPYILKQTANINNRESRHKQYSQKNLNVNYGKLQSQNLSDHHYNKHLPYSFQQSSQKNRGPGHIKQAYSSSEEQQDCKFSNRERPGIDYHNSRAQGNTPRQHQYSNDGYQYGGQKSKYTYQMLNQDSFNNYSRQPQADSHQTSKFQRDEESLHKYNFRFRNL